MGELAFSHIKRFLSLALLMLVFAACSRDKAPKIHIHEGPKGDISERRDVSDPEGAGRELIDISLSQDIDLHIEHFEALYSELFDVDRLAGLLEESREQTADKLEKFLTSLNFIKNQNRLGDVDWSKKLKGVETVMISGCTTGTIEECRFTDFFKRDFRMSLLAHEIADTKGLAKDKVLWLKYAYHLSNSQVSESIDRSFLEVTIQYYSEVIFKKDKMDEWRASSLSAPLYKEWDSFNNLLVTAIGRLVSKGVDLSNFIGQFDSNIYSGQLSQFFSKGVVDFIHSYFLQQLKNDAHRQSAKLKLKQIIKTSEGNTKVLTEFVESKMPGGLNRLLKIDPRVFSVEMDDDSDLYYYIFNLIFIENRGSFAKALVEGLDLKDHEKFFKFANNYLKLQFFNALISNNSDVAPLYKKALESGLVEDLKAIYDASIGEMYDNWKEFKVNVGRIYTFTQRNIANLDEFNSSHALYSEVKEFKKFLSFLPRNIQLMASLPQQIGIFYLVTLFNKRVSFKDDFNAIDPEKAFPSFYGGSQLTSSKAQQMFSFSGRQSGSGVSQFDAFTSTYYFIELGMIEEYGIGADKFFATIMSSYLRYDREWGSDSGEDDDDGGVTTLSGDVILNNYGQFYGSLNNATTNEVLRLCRGLNQMRESGTQLQGFTRKVHITDIYDQAFLGDLTSKHRYMTYLQKLFQYSQKQDHSEPVVDEVYEFLRSDLDPRLRKFITLRDAYFRRSESLGVSDVSRIDVDAVFDRFLVPRRELLSVLDKLLGEAFQCGLLLMEEEYNRRKFIVDADINHFRVLGDVFSILKRGSGGDLEIPIESISLDDSSKSKLLNHLRDSSEEISSWSEFVGANQGKGINSIILNWYKGRFLLKEMLAVAGYSEDFDSRANLSLNEKGNIVLKIPYYFSYFRIAEYMKRGYRTSDGSIEKLDLVEEEIGFNFPDNFDEFISSDEHEFERITEKPDIILEYSGDHADDFIKQGIQLVFKYPTMNWFNYYANYQAFLKNFSNISGYYKYHFNSDLNLEKWSNCDDSCYSDLSELYRKNSEILVGFVNRLNSAARLSQEDFDRLSLIDFDDYFGGHHGPHKLFINRLSTNSQENYLGLYDLLYKEMTRLLGGNESIHRFHRSTDHFINELKRVNPFDQAIEFYDFLRALDLELIIPMEEEARMQVLNNHKGLVVAEELIIDSLDEAIDRSEYLSLIDVYRFSTVDEPWLAPRKLSYGTRSAVKSQLDEFHRRTANTFKRQHSGQSLQ